MLPDEGESELREESVSEEVGVSGFLSSLAAARGRGGVSADCLPLPFPFGGPLSSPLPAACDDDERRVCLMLINVLVCEHCV